MIVTFPASRVMDTLPAVEVDEELVPARGSFDRAA